MQTLNQISNGQSVLIKAVSNSELKIKLIELGLIEGQVLSVLFRAPLGDPMAIDIDGSVLSLRLSEAELIQVDHLTSLG
jgi:Fe2+ transport system protein FeoA